MSSIRLLVLGVVRIFQPVHGYDVRRELLSWRADEWAHVQAGSIYNALKSLTKDGLLAVEGTGQVGGRPERTSYRLTAEGESELMSLARDTWWTVEQPLDALMPALSFMALLRREELIAALRHRIVTIRGALERHAHMSRLPLPPDKPAHVMEMFRLMSARLAAEIDWAEALIARLERGEYQTADELAPAATPAKAAQPAKKTRKKAR